MLRETSREAYQSLVNDGELSRKHGQIYSVLYRNGPLTAAEVKEFIRSHTNIILSTNSETVRNRITELVKMGVVRIISKKKCEITGRNVFLYDVTMITHKKKLESKKEEVKKAVTKAIEILEHIECNAFIDKITVEKCINDLRCIL